jgi:hypothetical protein
VPIERAKPAIGFKMRIAGIYQTILKQFSEWHQRSLSLPPHSDSGGTSALVSDSGGAMNTWLNSVVIKVIVWLAGEILLGLIGLDTLADYSEFLLNHQPHLEIHGTASISLLTDVPNASASMLLR